MTSGLSWDPKFNSTGAFKVRIAVDVMGSDTSPDHLVKAVKEAASRLGTGHTFVLLASPSICEEVYPGIETIPVTEVIGMDEDPLRAIRSKKNASVLLGLKLLRKKKIDAFVSAGNTGALTAGAALSLPRLPGIQRPALLATLPSQRGGVTVLDVGGNVYCKARHLVQFAHLGAAYHLFNKPHTKVRVGLLNIGVESSKGTAELKTAYRQLEQGILEEIVFIGNVEARAVFTEEVDVVITDGFTGNILLKTAEGTASFILQQLQQRLPLCDHTKQPGALLAGVEGLVIKCHGASTQENIIQTLFRAKDLVEKKFISALKGFLSGPLRLKEAASMAQWEAQTLL